MVYMICILYTDKLCFMHCILYIYIYHVYYIYYVEFASRDRRTLVGIRRLIRGAGLKFSPRFRMNLAGFRAQTEPKSKKICSGRRSLKNLREEASPRANQERPRAAPKLPRKAQGRAKGVKLAARRVPEEPQEESRGALERPRRPFRRFESGKSRHSRALCGVSRANCAFDSIFR